MAGKNTKVKNVIIVGALSLILGFLLGQLLPIPFFQNANLLGTMTRPGDTHKRR